MCGCIFITEAIMNYLWSYLQVSSRSMARCLTETLSPSVILHPGRKGLPGGAVPYRTPDLLQE
jgi:hypothetical protein